MLLIIQRSNFLFQVPYGSINFFSKYSSFFNEQTHNESQWQNRSKPDPRLRRLPSFIVTNLTIVYNTSNLYQIIFFFLY